MLWIYLVIVLAWCGFEIAHNTEELTLRYMGMLFLRSLLWPFGFGFLIGWLTVGKFTRDWIPEFNRRIKWPKR